MACVVVRDPREGETRKHVHVVGVGGDEGSSLWSMQRGKGVLVGGRGVQKGGERVMRCKRGGVSMSMS